MLHTTLDDIGVGPRSFPTPPLSISVDSCGNFFAAVIEHLVKKEGRRMIHKLAPDGATLATFGGYGVKSGEFLYPVAAAVAPDDSALVLNAETHLVQRSDNGGKYLSSFGGQGDGEGTFNKPRNLCVGHDGAIYVRDYGNRQVQRFSADGHYETRWAFRRAADRIGMRVLNGFAVDQTGNTLPFRSD